MIARCITSFWKKRKKYRLLDVGAGNGTLLRMLRPYALEISAIEPDSKLANQLRTTNTNIRVYEKKWENSHLTSQYDAIIASHVFYYFPRPSWKQQINKMVRSLTKDGKLFIVVNSPQTGFMDLLSLATRRGLSSQPTQSDVATLRKAAKHLRLKAAVGTISCRVTVSSWNKFLALCQFHLELTSGRLKEIEKKLWQYYTALKIYKGKKIINYTLTGFCVSRNDFI